ncbi:N-acetyltransferase [Histoplasma capsulatum var. duboisii H88]|uniref:N-acetyltransferase n=2 Tax=Ajellomyces capsulatus (strain H88) TaxID=544711 RepID=A0A8A1LE86_AJEC8|nr:N-acetyltransferase [Histoplasma capsulatum var. duboisii H88]
MSKAWSIFTVKMNPPQNRHYYHISSSSNSATKKFRAFRMELLPKEPVYVTFPTTLSSMESSRLLIRPIVDTDAPALFAIRSRPEVAEHNHPKEPFKSLEQTREWMTFKIYKDGPPDIVGRSFNFAILDKSIPDTQEQLIGYVSVNMVVPCPEIGYSLLPESWGKGYATEALQMMLKIWWDLPKRNDTESRGGDGGDGKRADKAYAVCQAGNHASRKVLTKAGFEIAEEITYEGDDLLLFATERPKA